MPRAPGKRLAGGHPRQRSKTRRRPEPITTTKFALAGDACVHGGWLAAAASLGDLEGRVHGGHPFRASSPFFTAGHSIPLLSREASSKSLLDDIETYLNPLSGKLLADDTLRLNKYLAAAKQLKLMLQLQLPPATQSNDTHQRAETLLNMVMTPLAMEFCHLRIWRRDALRHDRLGVSPVSIWETARRSCRGTCSSDSVASCPSSSGSFTGTSGSSGGSLSVSALCEDMSVRSGKALGLRDLIDRKRLSTLNHIAGVMIEGGYDHILRRAIDQYSAQLASYIEILDINNILGGGKEESQEIILKVWTVSMHIIVAVLSVMQRQLNGQDLGYFNTLKEDYFLAIAKQAIMKLLRAAGSFWIQSATIDPVYMDTFTALKPDLSKMLNLVMMYQALNYNMPRILALLTGETKKSILAEAEGLIHRLAEMFVKQSIEQNDLVISQRLDISDTGVHRCTRHIMDHMRMLVQHKSAVCLMLKGDLKAFHEVVARLISSLESMLDMNSKGLKLPGQPQLFLLNNVHFMLQEVNRENDLGPILGEGWLLQRHDQLNTFITGYVDTSWTPLISCLLRRTRLTEILWPHQLFDKFTSLFETTYRVHKTWNITDPLIRNKVREAIFHKLIPGYQMHMDNYSEKQQKSARYSIKQLESQLQELFEG